MKKWWPIIGLLLVAMTATAQTRVEDVQTFTLKNGMKVMVLEDHSIPNANMFFFWRVGSRNEVPGITGLSHFFEHMMFLGAEKYGPKEFDRVMEAAGGANNAYTTENMTVYTDFYPSTALETIFDLEADRIGHLSFDSTRVESERGVVLSERITGMENSHYRFLHEQLKAAAFMAHPYQWSVLGWESDIRNWKRSDLVKYFETYYAPNNGVMVISGDVKVDEVKALCEKYIEPIPAHEPPRPVHTTEPEQVGERRIMVYRNVSSPHIMMGYHVPATSHEDYYALDLLDGILSEGRSSRLYSSLVDEKQLAVQATSSMPRAFDPNLFYFYAICADGVNEADLEAAIYEELDKIAKEGVDEKELQKIKNRRLVGFYRSMETIYGKSNTIGTYELFFGDYKKLFTAPDEYNKVTVDDIKRVAAKYFKQKNRTVGILKPEEVAS